MAELKDGNVRTFDITPGPAITMAFTVQPSGGVATVAWGSQPIVSLLDAGGNVATAGNVTVYVALAAGTAGLWAQGTASVVSSRGEWRRRDASPAASLRRFTRCHQS